MQITPMSALIYGALIVWIIYRATQPQRTSVTRMWIFAGLLIFLAAFAVYGSIMHFAPPWWEIAVAAVAGIALGIPVGVLRGHHAQVSATDRHGVMQLGANWQTAVIFLGAFAARFAVRFVFPPTSAVGNVVGDGLLFFAIGFICTSYLAIYRKYEALDHAAPQNG